MKLMKIAFVSNHPAPYRDPFLNRIVKDPRIECDVYSLFPRDAGHAFWNLTRPEYNQTVIVPKPRPKLRVFFYLLKTFVWGRYDCTVWPGFLLWYLVLAMFISALLGKRYGFTADTVQQLPISRIAFAIKRFIIRRSSIILVPGVASRDYFVRTFGVDPGIVCLGGYALDNKLLADRISKLRAMRSELRMTYGLTEADKVFLMVANMIPTRHYPITTAGFIKVAGKYQNARFVIVGSGPDLRRMQDVAEQNSALKVYAGVPFDEMLRLYAMADVYVHGGTEPASTALVIGAVARLPILSSDAVGCSHDCLKSGVTGVRVEDFLSEDCWAKGFDEMMTRCPEWPDMGAEAATLAERLDVDPTVDHFVSIVSGKEAL